MPIKKELIIKDVIEDLLKKHGDEFGDSIVVQILDQNGDEIGYLDCNTDSGLYDFKTFTQTLNKVNKIEYEEDFYNDQFDDPEEEVIKPGYRIYVQIGG